MAKNNSLSSITPALAKSMAQAQNDVAEAQSLKMKYFCFKSVVKKYQLMEIWKRILFLDPASCPYCARQSGQDG
ncbi:hypothetical protein B4923_06645 [Brenneria roseae subsp. americana]|uniref:Uncharacterized protein n=1 Tax=Brenneria roseae subsp. americana TaxID=1508507 RepID=A0A2U1TW32_9GAMM|nr:hypothetical protein [Brenneria roseae]PWC13621.1 hypothetical protein B4923_06645 [Brenneria roseae subsp. americana]